MSTKFVQPARHSVALRKESVDRNWRYSGLAAWVFSVALRKESVDRNLGVHIEDLLDPVALRKESVDRNGVAGAAVIDGPRRSPQGERG